MKKAREAKGTAKEADGMTKVPDNPMRAAFQVDLEKAKKATKNAKGGLTTAASHIFAFYINLLAIEAKYAWNKIIKKQMEGNPYVDLQGVSQPGPRGMSSKSFDNCGLFHLLTVFPINAADLEKYYITNVFKKPQRANVHQFVWQVEQLNTYIMQMACFYYSCSTSVNTKPKNVPFTEAELGAHVRCALSSGRTSTISTRRV